MSLAALLQPATAQRVDCGQLSKIAAVAKAQSIQLLPTGGGRVPDYMMELVAAYRSFQLQPRNKAAADRLLRLIPADKDQELVTLTLGDSLCDAEPLKDMRSSVGLGMGSPVSWREPCY